MRYLRAKGIRKALRQFHFLCGLKAPYRVLLDGNFIAMCTQMKVDVRERVAKYLQVKPHECEFYVPRAALEELQLLKEVTREAYELAQSFEVAEVDDRASDGADAPVDVSKAIQSIIGDRNSRKFVVCTQEVELRKALRLVPGVPLMYLNRSVLVFEEISHATLAIVRQEEKASMAKLDVNEKRKLEALLEGERSGSSSGGGAGAGDDHADKQRLQKKRAKGPNPLSIKKPAHKKVRSRKRKN